MLRWGQSSLWGRDASGRGPRTGWPGPDTTSRCSTPTVPATAARAPEARRVSCAWLWRRGNLHAGRGDRSNSGIFERVDPTLFRETGVLWMAREGDTLTTSTLATLERVGRYVAAAVNIVPPPVGLARRFPALHDAPLVSAEVCQYENTYSGHFLIDRHPELENVWLVGDGSGHGFKHGPVVGEDVGAACGRGRRNRRALPARDEREGPAANGLLTTSSRSRQP